MGVAHMTMGRTYCSLAAFVRADAPAFGDTLAALLARTRFSYSNMYHGDNAHCSTTRWSSAMLSFGQCHQMNPIGHSGTPFRLKVQHRSSLYWPVASLTGRTERSRFERRGVGIRSRSLLLRPASAGSGTACGTAWVTIAPHVTSAPHGWPAYSVRSRRHTPKLS